MKVLIRFRGDNDFGTVLRAFGELLLYKAQREHELLTTANIAEWFNRIAPTLYMMKQCEERSDAEWVRMQAYLRITPADVYINKAVDEKMKTAHLWANYDSVMIDGSEHAREKVYLV
jgi:hypothetical protein